METRRRPQVGASCSATLHVTHSESAAVAGTVVRENTALLTGVEATKRRGDVTPEDGAGAAESESEAVGEPAAFAALPAEQRRSDMRSCAVKNHVSPKAIPGTGRIVTVTKEANRRLLYDIVVESGGQKTVSLLVPHVEASEGSHPHDPRTRSVDVQQQRRDFQDPVHVVTDCNTPFCKSSCEDSSPDSFLTGGCTVPPFFNAGQGGKAWNFQGHGSTEQNTDRAEAIAHELDGRRAENDRTDGVERLTPVCHVTEFKDLALDAALLHNLRVLGFRTPSPVQCALIPRALDGKNLIVQAKSGTGKTLAFALYLLHALRQRFKQRLVHLAASSGLAPPRTASQRAHAPRNAEGDGQCVFTDRDASATEDAQLQKPASICEPLSSSAAADADCIAMALVVTPTRELTIQVANEISRLGWRMRQPHLRHACFFGGRPLSVCHQQLAQKPHVLISTPGRLLGLLRSQTTRKAVAAWPCSCARAVCLHLVQCSHNGCKRSVEEQQLRSDKHTTSATLRGNTCVSTSDAQQDSEVTIKEEKRDRKMSQVLQSHSDEESCGNLTTLAAGCDERLSLSKRLRQRLCIMVLDEADMLLGHFFRRQTKKLLSTILHPRLQVLATSATFPPPCINFLEQLCLSLDSEKQRGPCQHPALHEPLCYTQNCGTGQSQQMRDAIADRTTSQSVESLVAAVEFIRDHSSGAAAADGRSAAVETYLTNLVERPALARSVSRDEVPECALECSSSEGMVKAEAARSGAEKSLDPERSQAGPAMSNRPVQAVNSIIHQPLPYTVEKPRIFEKVMLCSSFIVHGEESDRTKCERVESDLTRWPILDDLGSAADSLCETSARRKVRFQDSEKDPTGAYSVEETRIFCEIPDSNASEEDGQRGCHFKQLNRTETKSVGAAAAIQPTEHSSEKKATVVSVQRQLKKSGKADEKGSVFTSYVSKRRDDACSTVESAPGKTALNEVSAVDANGSSLPAADDFHPTDVTLEQSGVIKTYDPSPGVPYEIQHQSVKPAEEEETSVWRERVASRLTSSPPTEDRNYSSGQMPGGSHINAHKKHKTESPSLVGIKYVIMTVEDEPSLMRQLGAKVRALQNIFANLMFRQAMIFCNQAEAGAQIAACLIQLGIPTLYTSSKLTQEQRVRNLLALKRVDCRVFVCSDVMSRGIDAAAVDLVINLDVPRDKDMFLHRSGRAGRFGGDGICVCIASKDELPFFEYLAISLKLTVFPSPEALSRLQWKHVPQRDGRGEEGVDDKKQENLFYCHIDCESGSQNTGSNEARQDVCAVLSQPVELVREHVIEGRNFECGDVRKPVPFTDPDGSTSALEQRSVAGLRGPETSQATVRRCCFAGAAVHAGGHVSEADPTGYQQRDALPASERAGPDTCDRGQPGKSSSYVHALLPASFTDEARSRGGRSRICNYPSVQGNAERSMDCVHLGDDVDGYYTVKCATKDLIDRNETGLAALLQEGAYKTAGTDFQIPFGREGCTVTVRSSLIDFNIYSSGPSSGMHLDACDSVQRRGSGSGFVDWSASLWSSASVLLQPYERLRQHGRQAATFLSKDTSILSSLAATALCAHDQAFCDACPSASVVVSDDAWDVAHCERQISANPRLLSLTQATSVHSEVQNMERRTSHVVACAPEQRRSEPKTCGESFPILFLEGAATFKKHVQDLKDWKRRILRERRADLGCTEIPAARRNNATAVGYALLYVKQTHLQFWENAEAMESQGEYSKITVRTSVVT